MYRMHSDEEWQLDSDLEERLWRARREAERSQRLARRAHRKQRVFSYCVFLTVLFASLYLTGHLLVAWFTR
jgi:hypothetical protein